MHQNECWSDTIDAVGNVGSILIEMASLVSCRRLGEVRLMSFGQQGGFL
ncbi:hypothetical protein [Agrobacterium sp. CG674]